MKAKKILPAEAAVIIGATPQYVRVGLQQGTLNIGSAVRMSSDYAYNISPALLGEYAGKSVSEIWEEVERIREGVKRKCDCK